VFKQLIARHESFRTSFHTINGEPVQVIHEDVEFAIRQSEEPIDQLVRPFDLSQAPLLRVILSPQHVIWPGGIIFIDTHHIITDGTSQAVLEREFKALLAGEALPTPGLRYRDYAVWQHNDLQQEAVERQAGYWQERFKGELPVPDLPYDFPRPLMQQYNGRRLSFLMNGELTAALKKLCTVTETTLYMVVLSACTILLSRLSGMEDIIIGTPSAGRRHADLQQVIGMFVNTLAMRNFPEGTKTYNDFLQEVKESTLAAFDNQDYPFEDLVDHVNVNRDTGRNPLFDVLFNLLNQADYSEGIEESDKICDLGETTSNFDITFQGVELEEAVYFTVNYSTGLFSKKTMEGIIGYLKKILQQLGSFSDGLLLSEIDLLSEERMKQLVYGFNDTEESFPEASTIHSLFFLQAEKTPEAPALVSGDRTLSYKRVADESSYFARVLMEKGVRSGNIVAIMAERSFEMIIGILAILKAGGAYLPIAPSFPEQRKNFILADSGVKILLTDNADITGLTTNAPQIVPLEIPADKRPIGNTVVTSWEAFPEGNRKNAAYIIYTSGSTGRPKGVMIEHGAALNLLFSLQRNYPLNAGDTYLKKTAFIFDVSVSEIFGWFMGGGRLFILEKEGEKDPGKILSAIAEGGVTHMNFVPSMFAAFINVLDKENPGQLAGLRYIFLAGEILPPELVERFRQVNSEVLLENLYGPTEATVYASGYSLANWGGAGSVPIGKPVSNVRLYILDKYGNPQVPGAPGELCISGNGLARGYINNPELTQSSFISHNTSGTCNTSQTQSQTSQAEIVLQDKSFGKSKTPSHAAGVPFSKGAPAPRGGILPYPCPRGGPAGGTLYRTGDLARYLADGNIEFLGRLDFQVKVRGHRIELEEIENRLLKSDGIERAAVVDKIDTKGELYLCAYVVGDTEKSDVETLRKYLAEFLPEYMIPAFFVQLDQLPLTPTGKINKSLLPKPKSQTADMVPPRDEVEKELAAIWAGILDLDKDTIGIDANFFHLGGHSLKATVLISEIQKQLDKIIALVEFFQFPTIRWLAQKIKTKAETVSPDSDENILQLRIGTDKKKHLFFVHDGTGEVEGYLELCRHLDKSFNCWGIKADRLTNCAPRNITIPGIAASYIPALRKIQPRGPYNIIGWSLGGIPAFEMVRQLEQAGEGTGLLAMVDSTFPGEKMGHRDWDVDEFSFQSELEWLREYFPDLAPEDRLKELSGFEGLWAYVMEYMERRFDTEQIRQLLSTEMVRGLLNYDSLSGRQLIYYFNIMRTLMRAVSMYKPQGKIDTPMVYLAAQDSTGTKKERWTNFCAKPVEYVTVPGDHFSIFQQPRVRKLADALERVLSGSG
ncbi:MAG: amino acid adenylation domain-containing protein, partial [bacterium]|nr:amino acid adenylation domain-containing protein [bacterium]